MQASDILGACGFSLTVAWVFLTTYSRILAVDPSHPAETFALARFVGMVSFAAGFYALKRFSRFASALRVQRVLLVLCALFGVLLPALYLANRAGAGVPLAVLGAAWAGHGLASAVLFGYWGRFSSMLPAAHILPTIAGVFFAAGCWYFIVSNLPYAHSILVLAAMPLLSLACFLVYERDSALPRGVDSSVAPWKQGSRADDLSGMLNGVVLGTVLFVVVLGESAPDAHVMVASSLAVAAAAVAAAVAMRGNSAVEYGLARRMLFPFSVASLVLLMLDLGPVSVALLFVLLAVFSVLDIVNWSTVALFGSLYRAQPIYAFSSVRLPFTVGTALGWLVGMAAFGELAPEFSTGFGQVAAAFIVLLAVSVSVAPFERGVRKREDADDDVPDERDSPGAWNRACIDVAARHGLTPREREVFLLLAKGRNAAVIEKELVVSSSTAKTHIYHVYRKLGVSSRQEVIDAVEAERARMRDEAQAAGSSSYWRNR